MQELKMVIDELEQHSAIIAFKLLMAAIGFCCCFAVFVGACFGLTQMSFLQSVLTAIIPSMLFGVWCSYSAKEK